MRKTLHCPICDTDKPLMHFPYSYTSINKSYNESRMFYCKDCCKKISQEIMWEYKSIRLGLKGICNFFSMPIVNNIIDDFAKAYEEEGCRTIVDWVSLYLKALKDNNIPEEAWDNYAHNVLMSDPLWRELDESELGTFKEIRDKWGDRPVSEYEFLEATWQRYTNGLTLTPAQESLYRQLCVCELNIREKEKARQSAATEQKMAITLMAKLDIDKFKSGKDSAENKMIEEKIYFIEHTDPADYFEDKDKFKDIQGIEEYTNDVLKRPMRNLLLNSNDYKIIEDYVEEHRGKKKRD